MFKRSSFSTTHNISGIIRSESECKLWACTCTGVLVLLVVCPGLRWLSVVIAAPLIKPRIRAGAAVAQLAFPAADYRVYSVYLLRALKTLFPDTLGVPPAVAKLPARFHINNDQQQSHNRGDRHRETSSPHSRPGGPRPHAGALEETERLLLPASKLVRGVIRWVGPMKGAEGMQCRSHKPLRGCHLLEKSRA